MWPSQRVRWPCRRSFRSQRDFAHASDGRISTGTAGKTYTVWRAPAVNGDWTVSGTVMVDVNGLASFTNAAPPAGSAFFRVSYP